MKTFHILSLAFALTVSPVLSSAHARPNNVAGHEISDSSATVIQEKIQNTVRLENNDQNSRVFVVFSIAENGSVSVLEIGSLDPAVKATITEQFQAMSFDNANGNYDGMYSIWLNFKSL
jgi:predicted transcriptional regulator